MKKIIYLVAIIILMNLLSLNIDANESIFATGFIPKYEERENFYIDKGELSKYISNMYENLSQTKLPDAPNHFVDVDTNIYNYIPKLYNMGIVTGVSDVEFGVANTVTYNEICNMIYNSVKLIYADVPLGDNPLNFAISRGLVPQDINPDDTITLKNAVDIMGKTMISAPHFEVVVNIEDKKDEPVVEDNTNVEEGPTAYLTFDDAPSENTIKILDTLKKYNVKATFYLTGNADPEIVKRMVAEGHAVGNHTFSHDYAYIYSSVENFFNDFYKEEAYLESILGYKTTLVRLPGGSNNSVSKKYGSSDIMQKITAELTQRGYTYTDCNSYSKYASTKNITPEQVKANVFETVKSDRDAVVLMHQTKGKEATAEALASIIEEFKNRGFKFDTVSETSFNAHFTIR